MQTPEMILRFGDKLICEADPGLKAHLGNDGVLAAMAEFQKLSEKGTEL